MLFSLDSVITAVGVADELWVMVAAIVSAMVLMLVASGPLATLVDFWRSCATRVRVCRNGLFWVGRGAEPPCNASAEAAS